MSCLRKDLGRRAQHASDIKIALEDLYEDSASRALRGAAATAVAPRSRVGRRAIAIGGVVLVVLAVVVIQMWRSRPAAPAPAGFIPIPLTSLTGREIFPTFSPDGSQVAFVWLREGPPIPDVYVQVIGESGAPFQLTNDDGQHTFPSWSPDGKSIALWHVPLGTFLGVPADLRLVILSPLGGAERQVLEWHGTAQRIAWSPDGRWLAVSPVGVRSIVTGITLVSPTTGERIEWASIDASYAGSTEPAFSFDGRRIAFTRERGDLVADVYVATVGADGRPIGPPMLLSQVGKGARWPLWTPDGEHLLLIDGSATSNGGVVRVRIDGGSPTERIGLSTTSLALSRDGTRLAISEAEPIRTSGEWTSGPGEGRASRIDLHEDARIPADSASPSRPTEEARARSGSRTSRERTLWRSPSSGDPFPAALDGHHPTAGRSRSTAGLRVIRTSSSSWPRAARCDS